MHTVDKYNMLHSAPRQLLVGFFRVLDFGSFACADWRLPCHCAADTGLRPQYFCAFIVIAPRRPRTSPSRTESLGGYLDDGLATRTAEASSTGVCEGARIQYANVR